LGSLWAWTKNQPTNDIVGLLRKGKFKCTHSYLSYKHYSHFKDHHTLQTPPKIAK